MICTRQEKRVICIIGGRAQQRSMCNQREQTPGADTSLAWDQMNETAQLHHLMQVMHAAMHEDDTGQLSRTHHEQVAHEDSSGCDLSSKADLAAAPHGQERLAHDLRQESNVGGSGEAEGSGHTV